VSHKYNADWHPAPSHTEWGDTILEGLVELSRDHTLSLYVEEFRADQVDEMLFAAANFDKIFAALRELQSAANTILYTGEFASWMNDQSMPWAAAKDLIELERALGTAFGAIASTTGRPL
jgi:hypothetical protein